MSWEKIKNKSMWKWIRKMLKEIWWLRAAVLLSNCALLIQIWGLQAAKLWQDSENDAPFFDLKSTFFNYVI